MHAAPSLVFFTTLSGLGLGLLTWLGIDPTPPTGWVALVFFALGHGLTLAGLGASALHLRRPERALKAFTQWRTSWLSREAWASAAALGVMGLHGLLLMLGVVVLPLGWLGAALALVTVGTTSMIYAQLRTVPRWHHWTTPALFLWLSLTGGALLAGRAGVALGMLPLAGALQLYTWWDGDGRFARAGTSLETATGLENASRPLFPPHTGSNYVMREMAGTVARRHVTKLRAIALFLMAILPVALPLPLPHVLGVLALVSHVAGVLVSRWLFFAEAEHVVSLYYGRR
ncbi:dimethyl sulfoxide reductase anchor subunit family protein [Salipiger mucosus]|uniref:Anaerobic dimethyl sulfoxide reductase chain C n=1 Tax=Salipiger mucosus DSM 16094 TaxID=1123237 RepID=S9S9N7_9RHOB|nr:DmsC/YnfH family molybdoenzyme membrane anchor subunit [Salipiger mucosus]EPX82974.1 Anaerobic dimethyl sulfoxide reductase chain C [Salipiger mucosus DSM 16094]